MSDVVVTVPKNFTHPAAPGKRGLAAWLAEGDAPGTEWSGTEWEYVTHGPLPICYPGERVYVVCEGRLVGYAPCIRAQFDQKAAQRCERDGKPYWGPVCFVRGGGAVACTIDERITGFRGFRYRWWDRADERPLQL